LGFRQHFEGLFVQLFGGVILSATKASAVLTASGVFVYDLSSQFDRRCGVAGLPVLLELFECGGGRQGSARHFGVNRREQPLLKFVEQCGEADGAQSG
jgi:hypothetical protein